MSTNPMVAINLPVIVKTEEFLPRVVAAERVGFITRYGARISSPVISIKNTSNDNTYLNFGES